MADADDVFPVKPVSAPSEPLVCAFFWHTREDGWEKVMFNGPKECGCCGERVWTGWLEMECDAIRCRECVPPERT